MSLSPNATTSNDSPSPLQITHPINPLHHLDRTVGLFQLSKFYHEGFIFRRTLLLSDGLPPKRPDQNPTWSKYYVQVSGTTMSCWDAKEIEIAAQQGRQVAPTYTNITDARVTITDQHQPPSLDHLDSPTPHIFSLNNAGRNKLAFACLDHSSLVQWVTSIRLSVWERSRLFEIYTGTLLGLRFQSSVDSPLPNDKIEGYLMVRFPKDTDWTRVWCQLVKDKSSALPHSQGHPHHLKWNQRRTSLFQLAGLVNRSHQQTTVSSGSSSDSEHPDPALIFYAKKGAKKHIGILHAVSFAAAVYPESRSLIDSSTIFKMEGLFERLQPDPRPSDLQVAGNPDPEGYLLASPDEGTEYDMLAWLLSVMSAFKLYGRPQSLNYDLTDPSSFYFAYPSGPERDKLFLDCHQACENIDPQEQSWSKLRRKLLSLVATRLRASSEPAVYSTEYDRDSHDISPQKLNSIADPEGNTLDSSVQSNPQVNTNPLPHSSPPNQIIPLIPAPEYPESTPDKPLSEPSSISDTFENALSGSASDRTSSTLARPSGNLHDSEELKSIHPSESIPPFDGELLSLAAYVTYPSDTSEDTNKTPHMPAVTSSDHPSPSVKLSSAHSLSSSDKSSQPSLHPPLTSLSPSQNAPPIKIGTELEEYDDMVYALNLVDDLNLAESSSRSQKVSSSSRSQEVSSAPEHLSIAKPSSVEPEFLSKPPPHSVEHRANSTPVSPNSAAPTGSFPSSFAVGKKSAARLAAAQAAQANEKSLSHRPGKSGRGASTGQKKPPSSWNSDSDDDDDDKSTDENEDDEDEDEEDERLKKHRLAGSASMSNVRLIDKAGFQQPQERNTLLHPQVRREAATSIYSTFSHSPDNRPMSHMSTNPNEMGQFPSAASRREMPSVLREQPVETGENSGMRQAFSQHGLLNRVMQERQEKSAKSIQEAAHWTGEPLVQVNHRPPPIQSGLLGAIASHERGRKRDGGMGAVLTEQARERAMRQRETDEFHRQSMYSMVPGSGFAGAGYPPNALLNSANMMPMMYTPQMVPNPTAMVPNPAAIYEQMLFQQHQIQMQQQAMMNAQQLYVSPYGYPGMPAGGNMVMMGGSVGGNNLTNHGGMMPSPHQSIYGYPNQSMNFNQMNGSSNGQVLSPTLGSHPGLPHSSSSGNVNANHNQKNHAFNPSGSRHP